ncbi:MAG: four helix bundle protein [Bacteroidales bacterium]
MVNLIYSDFKNCRDFTFRYQITGARISIMNNISEGFCRKSDAEFRHFLSISKGSSGEVKNMYYIGEDLKYIDYETAAERRSKCQKLMNGIGSFMKYLNSDR